MNGIDAFLLALVQMWQKRHDDAIAMQRSAAEAQMYHDLLEQARTLLASLKAAGDDSALRKRIFEQAIRMLTAAGSAFKRFLAGTLVECLDDRAFAPGVAAAASERMLGALNHLLSVTENHINWVEHGMRRPLLNAMLLQPYRPVDVADFAIYLAGIESELEIVAEATVRASNDITFAHEPISYLLDKRIVSTAQLKHVAAPRTQQIGAGRETSVIEILRNIYRSLLLFLKEYALIIRNNLTRRDQSAAGPRVYTVRGQIRMAVEMEAQAAVYIDALCRTMTIAGQNIVDAA